MTIVDIQSSKPLLVDNLPPFLRVQAIILVTNWLQIYFELERNSSQKCDNLSSCLINSFTVYSMTSTVIALSLNYNLQSSKKLLCHIHQ